MMNGATLQAFAVTDRALVTNLAKTFATACDCADVVAFRWTSRSDDLSGHALSPWAWKRWIEDTPRVPIPHWLHWHSKYMSHHGTYEDPPETCTKCNRLLRTAINMVAEELSDKHEREGLEFEEDKEHLFLCVRFPSLSPLHQTDLLSSLLQQRVPQVGQKALERGLRRARRRRSSIAEVSQDRRDEGRGSLIGREQANRIL